MFPPAITESTKAERQAYVEEQYACQHNCEICGHCQMLHGQSVGDAYADYISGKQTYMEVTMVLRRG